ncbi:molybdopterin molybdenumtransferase MoeA, partial [Micromonospora zhanjiangensis]
MSAQPAVAPAVEAPVAWAEARARVYAVGRADAPAPVVLPLAEADGTTLAEPLSPRTDLPAFPTSSVDGWAVRGDGPWRPVGRVLAGGTPAPLTED